MEKILGNLINKIASRKRLADRHIGWKQRYREKSKDMKRKFDTILPGSYFRWEGKDYESGHWYYIIVAPSVSERFGKAFFAGQKKLPRNPRKKTYSPSGKYFSTLREALRHAHEYWGTPVPREAGNYSTKNLIPIDIPRHVKS